MFCVLILAKQIASWVIIMICDYILKCINMMKQKEANLIHWDMNVCVYLVIQTAVSDFWLPLTAQYTPRYP